MRKINLKRSVLEQIQNNDIQTIRINVMDLSGISRVRNVPTDMFVNSVMDYGLDYPSATFLMDSSSRLVEDDQLNGYPSWILLPDLSTFTPLPWAPGVAKVIADVVDPHGNSIPYSPRMVLKKIVSKIEEKGIRIRGAFEFEFYIFKDSEKLIPVLDSSNAYSEIGQIKVSQILDDILRKLKGIGSIPEVGNTEYGRGQFEITHKPLDGISIADGAVYYKSAIKEMMLQRGLMATFMSMPLADSSSSGGHLHFSMYDTKGNNLFHNPSEQYGLSVMAKQFIAGLLHHARALNPLCNSTINSFKRIHHHIFAPSKVTWGLDNRTCMIRVPRFRDKDTRIENRLPGADTNPYISLAAILLAGFDGIDSNIELPQPIDGNANLVEAEVLGTDLLQALNDLEKDVLFKLHLGDDFLNRYMSIRLSEYKRYQSQITPWEIQEYLELF